MTNQSEFGLFGRAAQILLSAHKVSTDDVEIIIRCKTPAAERAINLAIHNAVAPSIIDADFVGIRDFEYLGVGYVLLLAPTLAEEVQQAIATRNRRRLDNA